MYTKIKYIFLDKVFSVILIIILLPIIMIISIVILFFQGRPIFFKQKRIGFKGKVFEIIKFRTMVINAESKGTGLDSYKDDSRVTKIGYFLRKTSLDELPQIFNILKGEMSFIGPRPPVIYHPYEYNDYPENIRKRFSLKPGVTGYAQINGRNNLSWNEKFAFDLYYVKNISIFFDIKIFFLTIVKVIKSEGSYDLEGK